MTLAYACVVMRTVMLTCATQICEILGIKSLFQGSSDDEVVASSINAYTRTSIFQWYAIRDDVCKCCVLRNRSVYVVNSKRECIYEPYSLMEKIMYIAGSVTISMHCFAGIQVAYLWRAQNLTWKDIEQIFVFVLLTVIIGTPLSNRVHIFRESE